MASLQTILEFRTITKKKKKRKKDTCILTLTSLTPQYTAYKFGVEGEGKEDRRRKQKQQMWNLCSFQH